MTLAARSRASAIAALLLLVLLAAAWLAYHPGLRGGFLFDDFANLPALGAFGPVDDAVTFWRYITSGTADPTGRPVALLTFLIDANDWPADPYPFKRTNVLLHLVNGALLAWLLIRLGRYVSSPCPSGAFDNEPTLRVRLAAILAAGLWMLHPLFVSTTLYIVQREAMLPATFALVGLIGFVLLRERVSAGRRSALIGSALWLGICTILATLSKANGALLPLLALLIELTLLARRQPITHPRTRTGWRIWIGLVLGAPVLLLFGWLARTAYHGFVEGVSAIRPWTLGERLMTEARIVTDYLGQLWLPRPYSIGVFNDGVSVSTGWLSPPTTLICLLFLAALLATAIVWRKRHPAYALAVLFFFAGHLLESTVVALELYFEHRNYLPAMLMFWPISLWLCSADAPLVKLRTVLACLLPVGLAVLTWLGASLWGNTRDQALLWAARNPGSARAQAYAAQIEMHRGHPQAAVDRLRDSLLAQPEEIQLALNLIGASCMTGGLSMRDLHAASTALETSRNIGNLAYTWFERGLAMAQSGQCEGFNLSALERLVTAAESNPNSMVIPGRRQDLAHIRGRIALARNDADAALKAFNRALADDPRPAAALTQAAILGSLGYPEHALRHLAVLDKIGWMESSMDIGMPMIHQSLLARQGYWRTEIDTLRQTLQEDVRNRTRGITSS